MSHVRSLMMQAESAESGGFRTNVRHAETPALAKDALLDAAVLIFKAQVGAANAALTRRWHCARRVVRFMIECKHERIKPPVRMYIRHAWFVSGT